MMLALSGNILFFLQAKINQENERNNIFFCFVQIGEWSSEKLSLQQQLSVSEQQTQEETRRLQQSITGLQSERQILQDRVVCVLFFQRFIFTSGVKTLCRCRGKYVNREILISNNL